MIENERIICEIVTFTLADSEWIEKIFKKQKNIFVYKFDAGCGRERFLVCEKDEVSE